MSSEGRVGGERGSSGVDLVGDERDPGGASESTEFWEKVYEARDRPSSGIPNPVLAGLAAPLTPGTALDLGCAHGDDATWLAGRGWQVTAVDVSATALRRASARAAELGVAERVDFQPHDLATSFPDGTFDLVYAVYLESPVDFGRAATLRRAAAAVAPGGRLLTVTHGSVRPWAWNQDPDTRFPTPEESLAALRLEPGAWDVEIAGTPEREATGPNGQIAAVTDIVVAVRRSDRAHARLTVTR